LSGKVPRLGSFIARTFLWLPACFAAWYFTAPAHAAIAGWLARVGLWLFREGLVEKVERGGYQLSFVTSVEIMQAGQRGVLVAEVNSLLYSYGLPLLAALALASRMPWRRALGALALVMPFAAWGVMFDALVQVIAQGQAVFGTAGLGGWRSEAVALGYQLGTLLLPALAPVALWAATNRPFIADMLQLGNHEAVLPQANARL
jgi:hypothetical protein